MSSTKCTNDEEFKFKLAVPGKARGDKTGTFYFVEHSGSTLDE